MATTQPAAYSAVSAAAPGPVRSQTVAWTGRHSQNTSASTRLAHSTNVARSAGAGTRRVHARLNHGRAITVCCAANSSSNAASIEAAAGQAERVPSSMFLGTPKSAKKPIAYPSMRRKNTNTPAAYRSINTAEVLSGSGGRPSVRSRTESVALVIPRR